MTLKGSPVHPTKEMMMQTDKYPILDDVEGDDYIHFRTRSVHQYGERWAAMAWEVMPSQDRDGVWLVHTYEIGTDEEGNFIDRGEMDSRHEFPSLGAAIQHIFLNKEVLS